jgi:hypothetical protein
MKHLKFFFFFLSLGTLVRLRSPPIRKQCATVDDTIQLLFALLFFLSSSYYHDAMGVHAENFMTLHRVPSFLPFFVILRWK